MMEWQPIETAPEPGTCERILYFQPTRNLCANILILDHNGGPFRRATHWMPLPDPPIEQHGEK